MVSLGFILKNNKVILYGQCIWQYVSFHYYEKGIVNS